MSDFLQEVSLRDEDEKIDIAAGKFVRSLPAPAKVDICQVKVKLPKCMVFQNKSTN